MIKLLGRVFVAGVAVGGLVMSGGASATTCESALSNFASCNGSASCEAQYTNQHPECFGGGSTTSTTQIGSTLFTQASTIGLAISGRTIFTRSNTGSSASIQRGSGVAAGETQPWNVWASHSGNSSRIRYTNIAATTTRTDNDADTTVLGGDYSFSPKVVVGMSVAVDRSSGSGQSGAFAATSTGNKGYTLAPYIGYQIDPVWAVDASAGWGEGEFSSGLVRADAKRWFAAGNLSYNRWMGSWQYTGKLSFMHGEEKYADSKNNGVTVARSASKNSVDQARLGIQVGYWANGFMPYAGLAYSSDVNRATSKAGGVDPLGRNAWVLSAGVNFFSLSSKVTGGIGYQQESGRTSSKNDTLMGNVNFRF